MTNESTDQQFDSLCRRVLEERWSFYPSEASELGHHQYDGMLPDLSETAVRSRLQQIAGGLDRLSEIHLEDLPAQERMDCRLLEMALRKETFELADLRAPETDPMAQLDHLNVTGYIQRDYAPLPDRVRSMTRLLSQVPEFLNTALNTLREELARPILDTSIESYGGMARFYRNDLSKVAREASDPGLRKTFDRAREDAATAVEAFVSSLNDRLDKATPHFAIGPGHFRKMLLYGEMVDLPISRLVEVGEADLRRNLDQLTEVAARIDRIRTVRELIEESREEHPSAESLIPDSRRILEELRQFVIDGGLVTVPSEQRCQVVETPPFMRWAFAAMDTPGLLETRALESYYYMTPVEAHWTQRQQEEWLSNFNYHTLKIVGIHEAYPGHFVHHLHSTSAPSLAGKSLDSYSFSEGWAHYTEEMVLDAGYGEDDPSLKLSQLCEALLRDCRFLCSIGMHTGDMDVEEATRFFMEKAFMEEFPARKEALRGTFDPGYLNYTLGKLMIMKLRDDCRRERGASFSLKEFHDALLSYGAPPVPLLRGQLLNDPAGASL